MLGEIIMQNEFWSFDGIDLDKVAVITEDDELVTYRTLNSDVDNKVALLPKMKSLIFLKVGNSYDSLVSYLACLRGQHPFLLIDAKIEEPTLSLLLKMYNPNFIADDYVIKRYSDYEHKLHDDLVMLMSTSGSTGSPKLVRLSANNLLTNTQAIVEYLGINQADRVITTLPMSYSYGLSVINSHLQVGATLIINNFGVVSREFWQKIKDFEVTTFSGVPFIFQMLKKLKYKRFDTSSIRYLTQAGGKLDNDTLMYFQSECKEASQNFVVMYGQTEASPRISYLPPDRLADKIGSIGIAIPSGFLSLEDEDGNKILEPNKEGQLVYQGPNVMMGYADTPEELLLGDIQKGTLKTGDIGYFDSDNYYFITGRAKRFIKMFGLRISLDSVDAWLSQRGVNAVAIGKDDLLVVCIESKDEVISEEIKKSISSNFKLNLNSVKTVLIQEIPRVNGGKIDFKTLGSLVYF